MAVICEFAGKPLDTSMLDKLLDISFPQGYIGGLVTVVLGQGTMRSLEKWGGFEHRRGQFSDVPLKKNDNDT